MKATTSQGELWLRFQHHHNTGTVCQICEPIPDGEVLATGRSLLHKMDINNYNKEKGRKLALNRALLNMKLNKATRKEIWNSYFNRLKTA